MKQNKTEVFIGGGGPAGLGAAIAARQAGLEVTLADCAQPPIDKACGEGIMPDGLAALRQLGINITSQDAFPFVGIRFFNRTHTVEARFSEGLGYGIKRVQLHQLLLKKAEELGVTMHWGTRISGLFSDGVLLSDRYLACKWLVCADGQNSRLRAWAGLDDRRSGQKRFGFRRHFRITPWSEFVEIYWSDYGEMYITPVAEDEICVALITRDPHLRFCQALPFFPQVAARLSHAAPSSREQGAVTPTLKLPSVYRKNIALIGEASGSVDAMTGEGLSMSFQQAVALAQAMKTENLAAYQSAHRRIARLPRIMARMMLAMDQHHRFRNRVFCALNAQPGLFSRLLAVHTGAIPPTSFGLGRTVSLGWYLLMA
jgi:flavin-dependent dehydrogenase